MSAGVASCPLLASRPRPQHVSTGEETGSGRKRKGVVEPDLQSLEPRFQPLEPHLQSSKPFNPTLPPAPTPRPQHTSAKKEKWHEASRFRLQSLEPRNPDMTPVPKYWQKRFSTDPRHRNKPCRNCEVFHLTCDGEPACDKCEQSAITTGTCGYHE
ncbi:hypothetical protein K504DRAFT_500095 [Pleomassaria siparia CBS 279.74]|uniref:Zn(2)-C6 fungal-type domain-containing protein n=1 Tax=Pleomassaria siparia CBS 279.74 TaxID=1314801 RepID=A0A6G1KFL6_9PLEO|nr:hypothetical protein K504DRAFT_500095 [Pleomassaria siparia CBS 279.74]